MGTLQAYWCAFVPSENIVPQLSGPLATRAFLLALVEEEPLLQISPVVLGPLQEN